jgi:hypothetical protein
MPAFVAEAVPKTTQRNQPFPTLVIFGVPAPETLVTVPDTKSKVASGKELQLEKIRPATLTSVRVDAFAKTDNAYVVVATSDATSATLCTLVVVSSISASPVNVPSGAVITLLETVALDLTQAALSNCSEYGSKFKGLTRKTPLLS